MVVLERFNPIEVHRGLPRNALLCSFEAAQCKFSPDMYLIQILMYDATSLGIMRLHTQVSHLTPRTSKAYTSARSIGVCAIWVCISSSSSFSQAHRIVEW